MWLLEKGTNLLKAHVGAFLIIGLGALVQFFLITRPIEFLLGNILPDDAFYYFEIARNLSLGLGSTFDGLTATNGYHPLWMLVLWPIYILAQTFSWGPVLPIQLALGLSILLNIITGFVVYRILSRFTQTAAVQLFGLFVFVFNPFLLYELINGLETSLALMLTSVFFLQALSLTEKTSVRSYVALGLVGGLMILARMDLIFYVAAVGLWVLYKEFANKTFQRTIAMGGVVALIILPFFAWNFITYGTILTSASGANELVNHVLIVQDNGDSMYQSVKAVFYNLHGQLRDLMIHAGAPEVSLLFVGAFLLLVALGKVRVPKTVPQIQPVHALMFGFALLFILNVAVRFTARTWYFVSFAIFFALITVFVLRAVESETTVSPMVKRVLFMLLAVFTAASFFVWWHKDLREHLGLQREMYVAAQWFNENVPDETLIGVFNAGVQGYFTDATVVNLDGLVNNQAYAAMKEQRLWEYMQQTGITYLSDFDIYIDYRYRSFYGIDDIREHLTHVLNLKVMESNKSKHGISIYEVHP